VETTKNYSYDHGFIELLNALTRLEIYNANGVL